MPLLNAFVRAFLLSHPELSTFSPACCGGGMVARRFCDESEIPGESACRVGFDRPANRSPGAAGSAPDASANTRDPQA